MKSSAHGSHPSAVGSGLVESLGSAVASSDAGVNMAEPGRVDFDFELAATRREAATHDRGPRARRGGPPLGALVAAAMGADGGSLTPATEERF
jgi:hypothetical protein